MGRRPRKAVVLCGCVRDRVEGREAEKLWAAVVRESPVFPSQSLWDGSQGLHCCRSGSARGWVSLFSSPKCTLLCCGWPTQLPLVSLLLLLFLLLYLRFCVRP